MHILAFIPHRSKINTVHVLNMKHFFPRPPHSQCVMNGLHDAIQFSNIRQQYCTSGVSENCIFFLPWKLVYGIDRCAASIVVQCTRSYRWKNN